MDQPADNCFDVRRISPEWPLDPAIDTTIHLMAERLKKICCPLTLRTNRTLKKDRTTLGKQPPATADYDGALNCRWTYAIECVTSRKNNQNTYFTPTENLTEMIGNPCKITKCQVRCDSP